MTRYEHLMTILMEEAAEVQQAVSKALRFGLDDKHPETGVSNLQQLNVELSQLDALVEMLIDMDVKLELNPRVKQQKVDSVNKWMNYSAVRGRLTPTTFAPRR